jgi:hypothetical protein
MTNSETTMNQPSSRATWRRFAPVALLVATAIPLAACGDEPSAAAHDHPPGADQRIADADRVAAMLASAGFQDVEVAEANGWASTLDTLGCFQDPALGGMGVHYVNADLMDSTVDITEPEALVYELDAAAAITGLVAHEYIVPVDAWDSRRPPRLFGRNFHRHPVLPLWVLHAWLWKANPSGMFVDWNPAVRQCPPGVPIFGRDLPAD